MTFDPAHGVREERMYLEGGRKNAGVLKHGVKGYISLVGHHDSNY